MSTVVDPDTSEHDVVADPARADPPATPETDACPNCGAPADPGQLMCLECGSRLALDYQRAPTWRLPAAIVGVVVLLAGIGVAIALAAVTNDANKTTAAAPTQPAAQSPPADSPPTASQPTPAPQPTTTAATPAPAPGGTPTGTAATATPAPAPAASGWPPGKSAFTVILASMPTKAAAEDKLQKAKDGGIASAAILHSDDFPTLRPGYWVVFDGQYDTIDQATSQASADRGKGEFADAYPRFVSKNEDAKP
jgi:eukaryotic-like serine/threonine-protein kinase